MQFELGAALIDEILFFMEDQHGDFLLDTREGIVLSTDSEEFRNCEDNDDGRFISLPDWGPSEGYRLMERFTATLRNALIREELSAALDRGRGVFRAFKNILARYPEAEKLWFNYKEREMKRLVISWYNGLRESWGLELIGEEPDDINDLVHEDFRFRKAAVSDRNSAEELHRICLESAGTETGADILHGMGGWIFPGDICFITETAGGEFAGYISAARFGDTCLRICALEIMPEYRGLGLGKTLITRLLEQAEGAKISRIIMDLPVGHEYFSRTLLRENFRPAVQRYCRDTP